ncbi:MAG: glycosyltransferase family 4 protein [Chloroherpetonaceae bacterium]
MKPKTLALIAQDIRQSGGVKSVTKLACRIAASNGLNPTILSYAPFKSNPDLSVSLFNAFGKGKIGKATTRYEETDIELIGAYFPEYEPNRYKTNSLWKETLARYDMHMVLGGSAINGVAIEPHVEKFIAWTATTIYDDRIDRLNRASPFFALQLLNLKKLQTLENRVLEKCSMLLLQSLYAKESVKRTGVQVKKEKIVPVGVDTEFYKPDEKRSKDYILFVGRFNDQRKNIGVLLKAYHILKEQQVKPLPKLKLAGATPSEEVLNRVAQLHLTQDVEFSGKVELGLLPTLYQGARLFVLPSIQEGLGIVILEAMASGVPVVSTRCGGPEIIIKHGENGLFCENNDAEDMAEKMASILVDEILSKKLAEKGRETVEEKFSVQAVEREIMASLREVYPEKF